MFCARKFQLVCVQVHGLALRALHVRLQIVITQQICGAKQQLLYLCVAILTNHNDVCQLLNLNITSTCSDMLVYCELLSICQLTGSTYHPKTLEDPTVNLPTNGNRRICSGSRCSLLATLILLLSKKKKELIILQMMDSSSTVWFCHVWKNPTYQHLASTPKHWLGNRTWCCLHRRRQIHLSRIASISLPSLLEDATEYLTPNCK